MQEIVETKCARCGIEMFTTQEEKEIYCLDCEAVKFKIKKEERR